MLALFYYNNGTAMPPEKQNHNYAPSVMNSKVMKWAANHNPIPKDILEQARGIAQ